MSNPIWILKMLPIRIISPAPCWCPRTNPSWGVCSYPCWCISSNPNWLSSTTPSRCLGSNPYRLCYTAPSWFFSFNYCLVMRWFDRCLSILSGLTAVLYLTVNIFRRILSRLRIRIMNATMSSWLM